MLFATIGKLDNKYVSPLVIRSRGSIGQKRRNIAKHAELFPVMHHDGPCLPGVQRPFVRVDGAILPCEKVNETLEYFVIGTVENGFDLKKIKPILNIGKLSENECRNCWCIRQCMLCVAQMDFDATPLREDKIMSCPKIQSDAIGSLHELCVLNEFGLDVEGMVAI
jgi:uncharacterized protein